MPGWSFAHSADELKQHIQLERTELVSSTARLPPPLAFPRRGVFAQTERIHREWVWGKDCPYHLPIYLGLKLLAIAWLSLRAITFAVQGAAPSLHSHAIFQKSWTLGLLHLPRIRLCALLLSLPVALGDWGITVSSGSWPDEVSWTLVCDDGSQLSGGAPFSGSSSAPTGASCTLTMEDSFGNG